MIAFFAEQAPGLVEQHPREDRGVIVVAIDHAAQRHVVLVKRRRVGGAPPVRNVRHDQHAEPVGPIELARRFDLDVFTEAVEADRPRPQDFVPQHAVGGERVVAGGMVRLIERELEEDRCAVDRDVRIVRAW